MLTYPRIEGEKVREHVPHERRDRTDVLLELEGVQEHGDGGGGAAEDEHQVDMVDLPLTQAVEESDLGAQHNRTEQDRTLL